MWMVTTLALLTVQSSPLDNEHRVQPGVPPIGLRHPSALRVIGADKISASSILRGLKDDREFLGASHFARPLEDYLEWLRRATTSGYKHEGFADVMVAVHANAEEGVITIELVEGAQLTAGEVQLEGAESLERDWVAAVLRSGSTRHAVGNYLPPPGPEWLEPPLTQYAGAQPPPSFWVPGGPARFSTFDQQRIESLVEQAVEAAGMRAAQITLRWERTDSRQLVPVVEVMHEGPRFLIDQVRIEGDFFDPASVLAEWVAVPARTPATASVLDAVSNRLRASGRFASVFAQFEALPSREGWVDLVLPVQQAPDAPDLEQQPFEEMALLRRSMIRLLENESGSVGIELQVKLSAPTTERLSETIAAEVIGLSPMDGDRWLLHLAVHGEFSALELSRTTTTGEATPMLRFWLNAQRGFLAFPLLGLVYEWSAVESRSLLTVGASYVIPASAAKRHLSLTMSGGVAKRNNDSETPLALSVRVTPAALLHILGRGETPSAQGEGLLVRTFPFDGGDLRGEVDRSNARFSVTATFNTELGEGTVRFGELVDVTAPAWSVADRFAEPPYSGDAVIGMLHASRVLRKRLSKPAALRTPEIVLILSGAHAMLREGRSRPLGGNGARAEFRIQHPPEQPEASSMVRATAERAALWLIERQPPGSWAAELARAAPLILLPRSPEDVEFGAEVMRLIGAHPDRGPLGAWWAAELCALGGQAGWASTMATEGRRDVSREAFLEECGSLLELEENAALEAVARAWREFHNRALDEGDDLLQEEERAMLIRTFGDSAPEMHDSSWLRAGLGSVWDGLLHELVDARLATLEASTKQR